MQLSLPIPELAQLALSAPTPNERIYCNRSLRLDQIDWVGFDMDYTLAIYRQHEMDRLSIEATVDKLVKRGYPERLRTMTYRTDFPIRGLLVDRKLGNVLMMDRYKYVKRAYHGFRELPLDERRQAYHTRRLRPASERYHWVDTLYGLSEVAVYAAVIDCLEGEGGHRVQYEKLFADVRDCIDQSHQDGSILDHIQADHARYVNRDPELARTLHHLRSSGKRLFVLTNSYPEYTEAMMSFLLDGALHPYSTWRSYFDLVVSASKKPTFFTEERPFMRVHGKDDWRPAKDLVRGELYAGGNLRDLMGALDTTPDRVLYVGDHIYGDVLKAHKSTAWRTALIVQEMDAELDAHQDVVHSLGRLDALDEIRSQLADDLRHHQGIVRRLQKKKDTGTITPAYEAERVRHRRAVDRLRTRLRATQREYDDLEKGVSHRFHPFWGSLFKAGAEQSSFGHQVEHYAGLYTSKVSNFLRYSPVHFFQSPRDRMPHEL